MTNEKLESLMEESISESKRTTHAVRTLVKFTFIEVTVALVAVVLSALLAFIAEDLTVGLIAGGVVLLFGGVLALLHGWTELKQSEADLS